MSRYDFMLAEKDDIPEIAELYRSILGTPGCTWDEDYPNKDTAREDIENKSLYILKDGGKIIAAAAAGSFDELGHLPWSIKNPCELARIGVSPAYQGQGIGTIILKYVIKAMKERGYDGIRMLVSKTNAAALAMYDKNGFERLGETYMFEHDFYCYEMRF